MRTLMKLAALLALVFATASVPAAARLSVPATAGPSLASIGPLAFGPDGTMYAADTQAATIFAIDLGAQASGAIAGAASVPNIDQKVAALLGTAADQITIADLAVHPKSHNAFLAVMRGQGAGAQAVLVRVDGAGKLDVVSTDAMTFKSVALPNPVAATTTGRSNRSQSVTDMAVADNRLWIAGLSNEEFSSKLWSVPLPLAAADRGASVEIWHGSHGRLETNAPVYTFVPKVVDGKSSLIAGYLCTPLVRFPISDLKPGDKVRGTTIAEFGAGNRPLDMILYTKGGKEYLLVSNTSHGVLKVATETFGTAAPITQPVPGGGAAGVPFEKIASMQGVVQLDKLDDTHSIVISRAGANMNLEALILP
jgi:hypothetical protein